jgi:hypothetical protein
MKLTIKRDRDYPIFWVIDARTKEQMAGPFGSAQDAKDFTAHPYTPESRDYDFRADPGSLYDMTHEYDES